MAVGIIFPELEVPYESGSQSPFLFTQKRAESGSPPAYERYSHSREEELGSPREISSLPSKACLILAQHCGPSAPQLLLTLQLPELSLGSPWGL